jgi:hypothetical protein
MVGERFGGKFDKKQGSRIQGFEGSRNTGISFSFLLSPFTFYLNLITFFGEEQQ